MYRRTRPTTFTLSQDVIDSYWLQGPLGIWVSSCGRCIIRFTRTKLWELRVGTETRVYGQLWEAKLEGIRRIRKYETTTDAT